MDDDSLGGSMNRQLFQENDTKRDTSGNEELFATHGKRTRQRRRK
jgi:hypothetical protein